MYHLVAFSFLVSFSLFSSSAPASSSSQEVSRIAAVVNDKIITKEDLNHRIKLALLSSGMEDNEANREYLKSQILNVMIDETLERQKAESYEIFCDDEKAELFLKDIEQRNNMPENHLKKMMQEKGIPLPVMIDHLKAGVVWRDYIRARYEPLVQIAEEEIDQALEELKQAKEQTQLLLSEILLEVSSNAAENEAYQDALKLVEKLRQGAHFSAVAQQFSQAASAAKGGDIGWIVPAHLKESTLIPALENLKAGEISNPLRTSEGYVIYLVRERKEAGESIGKQTLLNFVQMLIPVSRLAGEEALRNTIFKAKTIADQAKSCEMMMKLVEKDGKIKIRQIKDGSLGAMPLPLRQIFESLENGQSSKPVVTEDGVLIFKLCERKDLDSEDFSRDAIKDRLIQQKLNLLAQRELRNLRRSGYIEIRI